MTLTALMFRSCQIIRRSSGSEDIYGNSIPTEDLVAATCELQPMFSDEPPAAGEVSRSGWVAFMPVDTDLRTDDALLVDEDEFELVGDPERFDSGSAAIHHLRVELKRVRGAEDSAS